MNAQTFTYSSRIIGSIGCDPTFVRGRGMALSPALHVPVKLQMCALEPTAQQDVGVCKPEKILRIVMTLLCGLEIPLHSFCWIPLHTFAGLVRITELVLRDRIPLLGYLTKPLHRFGWVPLHTLAVFVCKREEVLSIVIPLLGGLPKPLHRFG